MEVMEALKAVVVAAGEKKAEDTIVQDLRGLSDLCHYQVICSSSNARQSLAISESIEASLKKKWRLGPLAVEGKKGGTWVLLDYGHFMVHIFEGPVRKYYSIEQLWPKAKLVEVKCESSVESEADDY